MRLKLQKVSLNSFLNFVLILTLILNCNTVYSAGGSNIPFEIIALFIIFLLLGTGKKVSVNNFKLVLLYIIYQIPLILVTARNESYIVTYLVKYIVYIGLLILVASQQDDFLGNTIRYFTDIIYFLAAISLIFFVLADVLKIVTPSGQIMLNWGYNESIPSYFGIYFHVSGYKGTVIHWKNSSIFAEAPVWAALLAIATTFELFYRKEKVRIKYIFIFYAAMLTTFSTTVYIFFILSFVAIIYVYYDVIIKSRYAKLFFFTFFFALILGGLIACFLILKDKSSRGISFLSRSDDLLSAFRVIKDHPIFGLGFGYDGSELLQYHSTERMAIGRTVGFGQSSDFAYLLTTGGLYFAPFYLAGLYGIANRCEGRKKYMTLGLLAYVFVISRTGATLLFFLWLTCGVYKLITAPNKGRVCTSQ